MSTLNNLLVGVLTGSFLGLCFYGGLWFTIKNSVITKSSYIFILSFFIRMIVLIAALYILLQYSNYLFIGAIAGLFISKHLIIGKIKCS